jgi:hypothetical protein
MIASPIVALMILAWPVAAQVTVLPTAAPAVATAQMLAPSLSVAITAGATQTLSSITDNAINSFPTPVAVTASWTTVLPGTLCVVAYFPTPAQALQNGTAAIASSLVKGSVNTGLGAGPYTAFTGTGCSFGVGTNGGSLKVLNFIVGGSGNGTGTLALQLDLRGQPALTPGTYSGTLVIRAVMQ